MIFQRSSMSNQVFLGSQVPRVICEIFCRGWESLNAQIGSMIASLKGMDVLIFTAGIGENAPLLRKRVCENFSFLGIELDDSQNEKGKPILSTDQSKIKVLLIHTNESLEIARQCWQILHKT